MRSAITVDLGYDPPLEPEGSLQPKDRRSVSPRWLCGSILTGLCGAALMGGAIYVSLQGDTLMAEPPERSTGQTVSSGTDRPGTSRKADKLVRAPEIDGAKRSFKSPVTMKIGDREVIKNRAFVRVASALSQTVGTYATDIPAFNPLRLFAEGNDLKTADNAPSPELSDVEVSVVKRELAPLTIDAAAPSLGDDDVVAQIEEEQRIALESGRRSTLPIPAQTMLSRTIRSGSPDFSALNPSSPIDAPFSNIQIAMFPENVTTLAKPESRSSTDLSNFEERIVMLKRDETLEQLLQAHRASPERIRNITTALGGRSVVNDLSEGQKVKILFGSGLNPSEGRQILRVSLLRDQGIKAIAAINDRNAFVSVAVPAEDIRAKQSLAKRQKADEEDESDEDEASGGVTLFESLYETGRKHDISPAIIEELVRIFAYDVDFQKRVGSDDSIDLFFSDSEEGDGQRLDIMSAALTIGGETRRVFRYQMDDGTIEYFDEQGRSLKKFLLRKPTEGEFRSGFGYRRHPILGYAKMHTGVDYAARIGTPIVAAGNGTVISAEWSSGYGRRIEIEHNNGYVTTYSHQSAFARGIKPGMRVRQGQVIGYIGNTGLSTGPHLHYEVSINGRYVDPLKIRVPRGRELDGRSMAEFKRQREQVEALIRRSETASQVAQTTSQ